MNTFACISEKFGPNAGGGGGGSPTRAQAGGKDPGKIDAALAAVTGELKKKGGRMKSPVAAAITSRMKSGRKAYWVLLDPDDFTIEQAAGVMAAV